MVEKHHPTSRPPKHRLHTVTPRRRMHLCDFGAKLDSCKGPDGDFDPGCVGPGGREGPDGGVVHMWVVRSFFGMDMCRQLRTYLHVLQEIERT